MSIEVYYFGCAPNDTGHYLWFPGFRSVGRGGPALPWKYRGFATGIQLVLDGSLTPRLTEQRQGPCAVHYVDGWTAVAWWDRTQDTRPGSNSAIIIAGYYFPDVALKIGREAFPAVFQRLDKAGVVLGLPALCNVTESKP